MSQRTGPIECIVPGCSASPRSLRDLPKDPQNVAGRWMALAASVVPVVCRLLVEQVSEESEPLAVYMSLNVCACKIGGLFAFSWQIDTVELKQLQVWQSHPTPVNVLTFSHLCLSSRKRLTDWETDITPLVGEELLVEVLDDIPLTMHNFVSTVTHGTCIHWGCLSSTRHLHNRNLSGTALNIPDFAFVAVDLL